MIAVFGLVNHLVVWIDARYSVRRLAMIFQEQLRLTVDLILFENNRNPVIVVGILDRKYVGYPRKFP
jgi:hypothetical protein